MIANLFIRRRPLLDQEIREPTLLAFGLTLAGSLILLAACVVGIIALPALGCVWWAFALLAGILAWLVLGRRRKAAPVTVRQRWFSRIVGGARWLFAGVLGC